jgi:hypothetical protein
MRISASILDMVEQGKDLCNIQRMYRDGDWRQNLPGWAGYILAMLCRVAGTWDGQGNGCFD